MLLLGRRTGQVVRCNRGAQIVTIEVTDVYNGRVRLTVRDGKREDRHVLRNNGTLRFSLGELCVTDVEFKTARIGFTCPYDVTILRAELAV